MIFAEIIKYESEINVDYRLIKKVNEKVWNSFVSGIEDDFKETNEEEQEEDNVS